MSWLPGYEEKQALQRALKILEKFSENPLPERWIGPMEMILIRVATDSVCETLTHHLQRIGGHPGEVETFLPLFSHAPSPTWPYRIWYAAMIALMAEKLRRKGTTADYADDADYHP